MDDEVVLVDLDRGNTDIGFIALLGRNGCWPVFDSTPNRISSTGTIVLYRCPKTPYA